MKQAQRQVTGNLPYRHVELRARLLADAVAVYLLISMFCLWG